MISEKTVIFSQILWKKIISPGTQGDFDLYLFIEEKKVLLKFDAELGNVLLNHLIYENITC